MAFRGPEVPPCACSQEIVSLSLSPVCARRATAPRQSHSRLALSTQESMPQKEGALHILTRIWRIRNSLSPVGPSVQSTGKQVMG